MFQGNAEIGFSHYPDRSKLATVYFFRHFNAALEEIRDIGRTDGENFWIRRYHSNATLFPLVRNVYQLTTAHCLIIYG